jgi:hypothetical protein
MILPKRLAQRGELVRVVSFTKLRSSLWAVYLPVNPKAQVTVIEQEDSSPERYSASGLVIRGSL